MEEQLLEILYLLAAAPSCCQKLNWLVALIFAEHHLGHWPKEAPQKWGRPYWTCLPAHWNHGRVFFWLRSDSIQMKPSLKLLLQCTKKQPFLHFSSTTPVLKFIHCRGSDDPSWLALSKSNQSQLDKSNSNISNWTKIINWDIPAVYDFEVSFFQDKDYR